MKTKQNAAHQKAGANFYQPINYSLFDYKNTSEIIDADALQIARFNRGRPAVHTELIIA